MHLQERRAQAGGRRFFARGGRRATERGPPEHRQIIRLFRREEILLHGATAASRGAATPSRHRCDSFPSDEVVGGFFFEFEAIRTKPRCSAQVPVV